MTDVKIRSTDEMIESTRLYGEYTRARKGAEEALRDYLGGQGTREQWARCLVSMQQDWDAWTAHLGLEE